MTLTATMETTIHATGRRNLPPVPRAAGDTPEAVQEIAQKAAQQFVARLRAAAPVFAAAAGAESAVVCEAVPPARHRRSRCRVVLRYSDGVESDVTFLGPATRPGRHTPLRFDIQIQRLLGTGQHREPAWLVPDADAPDGTAVDVAAWTARG